LLVEDELQFAGPVRTALERERFVVDHVERVDTAQEAAAMAAYDLALVDRTLPDGDGLTLVPMLRANNPGLPIMILSARGELTDRIVGLDEGADDYLVKPFSLDELLARIRALRRRPTEIVSDRIRLGALAFSLANEEAVVSGMRLDLTRRETRVLAALMKQRRRTVLRESLEQSVYGFDDEVQANALDTHVSRLRRKLREAGAGVRIHPIRGVGYLLNEA
jgi:DNA-binding response OmpR family regulator